MDRISLKQKIGINVLAYLVCLLMFFPIFWLILTSFKTNALPRPCIPSSSSHPLCTAT